MRNIKMTEIERIKKSIESAVTVFVGQDENEQGIILSKHSLFHLITTIESQNTIINQQQEAIKYWQNDSKLSTDCSSRKEAFINSQKEEIERVTKRMKDYELQAIKNINLYESLKAITELAVKGLEKYGDMIVLDSEDRPHDVGMVARETLFEIEKLSQ